jgi:HEAT repeat protein
MERMSIWIGLLGLFALTGLQLVSFFKMADNPTASEAAVPADDDPEDPDVEFLKRMGMGTDGPSLIEFLRKRSPTDVDPDHFELLIRQLGDPSFERREQASRKLAELELAPLFALRNARNDPDKEIARRVRELVERQEHNAFWGLPLAAVRGLMKKRPLGTLEVLLRYLPFAVWDDLIQEIWYGINTLALTKGKVDPALLAALNDTSQARRSVSACIIGKLGDPHHKALVRPLLTDKEPLVRLRTAQGLLAGKDMTGIPTLIALLEDSSLRICWQAEELLRWVAGNGAPEGTIGAGTQEERKRCSKDWKTWWKNNSNKINFDRLYQDLRRPVLLMIVENLSSPRDNYQFRVLLVGCDGVPRWQFKTETFPLPSRSVDGGHLLMTDHMNSHVRIVEVNPLGTRIYQSNTNIAPTYIQRLPNGNTFLSDTVGFQECSSLGDELYFDIFNCRERDRNFRSTSEARKLGNGHVLFLSPKDLSFVEYDAASKKEIKVVKREPASTALSEANIQSFSEKELLLFSTNNVVKYSRHGKKLWELPVPFPTFAFPLGNRHLLLACSWEFGGALMEINEDGKKVWETLFRGSQRIFDIPTNLALVSFGFERPTCPTWNSLSFRLQALRDNDPGIRRAAASLFGPRDTPAIPALIESLGDNDEIAQKLIGRALFGMGQESLPRLITALQHKNPVVRLAIVDILGQFTDQNESVVPALIESLTDESPPVRERAVCALSEIRSKGRVIVSALKRTLHDKDVHVRRSSAPMMPRR